MTLFYSSSCSSWFSIARQTLALFELSPHHPVIPTHPINTIRMIFVQQKGQAGCSAAEYFHLFQSGVNCDSTFCD